MELIRENYVTIYIRKEPLVDIDINEALEKLRKYCKHFYLKIINEYVDDKFNCGDESIYNEFLNDIQERKVNIVLSYNFDTISIDDLEIDRLMNILAVNNCELHLENYHEYYKVARPLFFLPHIENNEYEYEEKPKKPARFRPIIKTEFYVNPKLPEIINWVDEYFGEKVTLEMKHNCDEDNNYYVERDVTLVKLKVVSFIPLNSKKKKNNVNQRSLFRKEENYG